MNRLPVMSSAAKSPALHILLYKQAGLSPLLLRKHRGRRPAPPLYPSSAEL